MAILAFLLIFFAPIVQAQITFGGTINAIEVEGNQRFSAEAVIHSQALRLGIHLMPLP